MPKAKKTFTLSRRRFKLVEIGRFAVNMEKAAILSNLKPTKKEISKFTKFANNFNDAVLLYIEEEKENAKKEKNSC